MRIATFNIAGGIDADDRFYSRRGTAKTAARVERARIAIAEIAGFAVDHQLDVLALQEVDVCHNGADTLHQAEALAAALGMHHAYLPCFDYDLLGRWTVTTGVATLSRLPIVAQRAHRFSQRRLPLRRQLRNRLLGAKAALEVTLEGGLRIVNAHLTHDHDAQKESELAWLLAHCAAIDPCVLVGDLNTTPPTTRAPTMREPGHFATDRAFALLERDRARFHADPRVFDPARVAEVCSYPSTGPDLKLDYVLVFAREVTVSAETIHGRTATSNHLPVSVTVQIGEQQPGRTGNRKPETGNRK